jgi:tetratricopeptide (TPR) repeat protein
MTFFELEKECKKRRIIFLFLFIIFVIFILIIAFYIYRNYLNKEVSRNLRKNAHIIKKFNKPLNNNKEMNHTKKVSKIIIVQKVTNKEINNTEVNKTVKKENILKPIIDLNIINSDIYENKTVLKYKKNHKEIINKSNVLNTSTLPSFKTCMLLAKNFYIGGDYENALKWAKNANIQDRNRPESWIMVAKSLYKLNKKNKAIEILQIYYNYTKNKKVLELIEGMKSDKIE